MNQNIEEIIKIAAANGSVVAIVIPPAKKEENRLKSLFPMLTPPSLNPILKAQSENRFLNAQELSEMGRDLAAEPKIWGMPVVHVPIEEILSDKKEKNPKRSEAQKAAWVRRKAAIAEAAKPKRGRPRKSN